MKFKIIRDEKGHIEYIETDLKGTQLLGNYQLNKDTAFTENERKAFNLLGNLPPRIETIEEQAKRCYAQFLEQPSDIAKYTYLNNLHNRNETLFYKLAGDHLEEMMPIVYTPTVGEAIQKFSNDYLAPSGLIISYPDKDRIAEILDNYSNLDIDLVVVTDAEGILGIGDQGVGGIYICVGKLAVYTLCADIDPYRVLPIHLDVGTNNEELLNNPLYLGWRNKRITGKEYDDFIDAFVSAVEKKFPNVFLHWEDFGKYTAHKNLARYQDKMCTFNDDIQGTGVVTLAALLSGVLANKQKITEQRVVFLGAGSSATGIADQICDAMVLEGLSIEEAHSRVWMLGSKGLLGTSAVALEDFQLAYVKNKEQIADWELSGGDKIGLFDVVKNVKPTALIGCSTAPKTFTEKIVKIMAQHVEHPIILPLSNPTSKSEAIPEDLMRWTDNKALVATGSPFPNTAQCNNAFAFPGIGLGILAAKARRCTKGMLWAACKALTNCSPISRGESRSFLLPHLHEVKKVSRKVAIAVVEQAIKEDIADKIDDVDKAINSVSWEAKYYEYKKKQ